MPFRRRNYRRRGIRRGLKRPSMRRKAVSKSVKRYVKRVIHRQIENKEIIDFTTNSTIKTLQSSTNDGGGCRQLLPLPASGTGENQRIGNAIRIVKGVIRGHVNLKAYDATFNPNGGPVWVRIMLFRKIQTQGTEAIQSSATFFDDIFKGNNTELGPQGNMLDITLPINDMKYRLLSQKVVKLGAASYSSTGVIPSSTYFDNSPMSAPFYFNWGKYCRKQIKFTESSTYPQNENCYLWIQPIQADGTSSSGYKLCEYHFVNHVKFEDA